MLILKICWEKSKQEKEVHQLSQVQTAWKDVRRTVGAQEHQRENTKLQGKKRRGGERDIAHLRLLLKQS